MKILITGASGFIGSFIVEEALRRGFETWAAVRRSSSRKYLQDDRIHFIELDLSSQEVLESQLKGMAFDEVSAQTGFLPYQYRRNQESGECPRLIADAAEAFCLYQQPEHHGGYPRATALRGNP